jgi:hypothetical protein
VATGKLDEAIDEKEGQSNAERGELCDEKEGQRVEDSTATLSVASNLGRIGDVG